MAWAELSSIGLFEYNNNIVHNNIDTADFVFGSTQLDDNGNPDYHNRFLFDKSKGAFRAGSVPNDYWDEVNLGNYS